MIDAQITTLAALDGSPVTNVAFALSAAQLAAAAHATGAVVLDRHRGVELDVEGVLALRELTSVRDELDDLAGAEGHATVVMTLARFVVLHDAVDEWVLSRTGSDLLREADLEALPFAAALLAPMAALRADAVQAALGGASPAR